MVKGRGRSVLLARARHAGPQCGRAFVLPALGTGEGEARILSEPGAGGVMPTYYGLQPFH